MKATTKRLGKILRDKRTEAGLTLQELADRCECHMTAISHIECGRREPRLALLSRVAAALGCTLDDFVDVTPRVE